MMHDGEVCCRTIGKNNIDHKPYHMWLQARASLLSSNLTLTALLYKKGSVFQAIQSNGRHARTASRITLHLPILLLSPILTYTCRSQSRANKINTDIYGHVHS